MITQARVRDLFNYDPFTGSLTNRVNRNSRAKKGDKAGYVELKGYRRVCVDRKQYRIHRLAWLWAFGEMPSEIDHINGIEGDNRLHNLREVTRQENQRNKRMLDSNTSGHVGVTWDKNRNKWMAQIVVSGQNKHFGRFDTKEEAIKVRKAAEVKYGFHKNHGRTA